MLSGYFKNCYGLNVFDLGDGIDFSKKKNIAIIYAPNGVMKTSFATTFDDLSRGVAPKDRLFLDSVTSYSIQYDAESYSFSSEKPTRIPKADNIYVVSSFTEGFVFSKETVSTFLADETIKKEYDALMQQLAGMVKEFETELALKSGISKVKIKDTLIVDFELESTADWPDIMNAIYDVKCKETPMDFLNEIKYAVLFSDKAMSAYSNSEFEKNISLYIERLSKLLEDSDLLSREFTDRSAEALTKSFASNNLFVEQHKVVLRDGTQIESIEEWRRIVEAQINRMYTDPTLKKAFEQMKKLLTASNEVDAARRTIIDHQEIIPLLSDIKSVKKSMWVAYCAHISRPFGEYYSEITKHTETIRELYKKADAQSERWKQAVDEFNRRFKVPFRIQINNKSNFVLKDEAPNLTFLYNREDGERTESVSLSKEELLPSLSMGEKRAMYLLYILFDLERIREKRQSQKRNLVIVDDIADSFDYKNKYAIIEYLSDISDNAAIDLLILTHNFDFFRTVRSRLSIEYNNCFIVQRDGSGKLKMNIFRYQKDFFKMVILAGISNEKDKHEQKKMLIASLPFYRNLAEYTGEEEACLKLTCFLHYKVSPICTETASLSDVWHVIKAYTSNKTVPFENKNFYDTIQQMAIEIAGGYDDVSLEDKLIVAIALRLKVEKHLKLLITEKEGACDDVDSNQTRVWIERAKQFLSPDDIALMDEVNMMTPEAIHLNAFMYEPLIDISSWSLNDLYRKCDGWEC